MRRLVVLGAGTAGTMLVNSLRPRLDDREWSITVVDQDRWHLYQPGLLQLPFGVTTTDELLRPRADYLPHGVGFELSPIERVDPEAHRVRLQDGRSLEYDYLVIATGTSPRPEETPGMTGEAWQHSIFDFYTLEGARALRDRLATWRGGRLVVHVVDTPIKCPVAPLEFSFLADAFFEERGLRAAVDLTYVTPLEGAFTRPVASSRLGSMLEQRHIALEGDFLTERIDAERRTVVSYDGREVPFDLLVTVPLNMGADFVARSGLGDELNYVPVDRETMVSKAHPDVFVLGDANDLPTSKAGSVAHFSVHVFVENFLELVKGRPMTHTFDGHANCFVESGHGKALLLDFNYDTEPLPGRFPLPGVGPLRLLGESHLNHLGKAGFAWAYWHLLLRGRPLPVPTHMSMAGKHAPAALQEGRTP
jgi:sulfide:quinone oxidoreductase